MVKEKNFMKSEFEDLEFPISSEMRKGNSLKSVSSLLMYFHWQKIYVKYGPDPVGLLDHKKNSSFLIVFMEIQIPWKQQKSNEGTYSEQLTGFWGKIIEFTCLQYFSLKFFFLGFCSHFWPELPRHLRIHSCREIFEI